MEVKLALGPGEEEGFLQSAQWGVTVALASEDG